MHSYFVSIISFILVILQLKITSGYIISKDLFSVPDSAHHGVGGVDLQSFLVCKHPTSKVKKERNLIKILPRVVSIEPESRTNEKKRRKNFQRNIIRLMLINELTSENAIPPYSNNIS